ncbi:MAG TPA: Ig-like domain-containing protein [Candidatus Limnocylindria bacterium]|nr:Ig-like domain-containing protein [Candidatus Limnocylindria bacterium]
MLYRALRRTLILSLILALTLAALPLGARAAALEGSAVLNKSTVAAGGTITATWTVTGGVPPYDIDYWWEISESDGTSYGSDTYNTSLASGSASLTPKVGVSGSFVMSITDANGTEVSCSTALFSITGAPAAMKANLALDKSVVLAGVPVTATWSLTGGAAPVSTSYYWYTVDAQGKLTESPADIVTGRTGSSAFTPAGGVSGAIVLEVDVGGGLVKSFTRTFTIVTAKPGDVLVSGVTVSPASAMLVPGETRQLTANVLPAGATNKAVAWTSSNTAVATVSASGLVTAKAVGTAVITAMAQDGSGASGTAAVTVNQAPALGKAEITLVEPINAAALKVVWKAVPGAAGYEVWRSTSSSMGYTLVKKVTATTFGNTYLQPGIRYFYKIRAYGAQAGQFGAYSAAKAGVPIGKSTLLTAQAVNSTRVKLTWTKADGAAAYEVLVSSVSGSGYRLLGTTAALSYTATNLKPGATYFFRIQPYLRAYGLSYYGPLSGYRAVKMPN